MKRDILDARRTKLSVVARKAAGDDAFRDRFMTDPMGVLKSLGVDLPEGVKLMVHQDAADVVNMVLPARAISGATASDGDPRRP
ncbi:MAG: hypothetical protein HC888_16880, partial [Candidatus Competibacteraceae bacterium]|nr:hypothetical protein [Candidatus Competibacteraceae bacterium]